MVRGRREAGHDEQQSYTTSAILKSGKLPPFDPMQLMRPPALAQSRHRRRRRRGHPADIPAASRPLS